MSLVHKNRKKLKTETLKNLERLLAKMQRSVDPFKINDPNLKYSILKEVLECQRLLLTKDLRHSDFISVDQISEEWKILAMIVDRIFFVCYLFSMVVSSSIFFACGYYGNLN